MSKILNKLAEIQSRLIAFDCRLDAHIRNDAQGDRWITTETGSHIKLNEAGAVVGGAGGKLNGKFYGVDKTSEARHTENKSNSGSGENKMEHNTRSEVINHLDSSISKFPGIKKRDVHNNSMGITLEMELITGKNNHALFFRVDGEKIIAYRGYDAKKENMIDEVVISNNINAENFCRKIFDNEVRL